MKDNFEMRKSIDGEYYNLYYCDKKVYQDSANEDLYDKESAEAFFDELTDGLSNRWSGIMKAAINDGFEPSADPNYDLRDMMGDAESYLIDNTPDEDCFVDIVTDFWSHPNYLLWMDEHNAVCIDASGEIVSNDYKLRSYFRYDGKTLTPAKWFENEDEDVYCYLDKAVDSDGNVWILIG